jgi:phosphinothricin acetyltransferase
LIENWRFWWAGARPENGFFARDGMRGGHARIEASRRAFRTPSRHFRVIFMNSSGPSALVIRDAAHGDFDTITRIYAHYVLHALATFEEVAPGSDEMRARHRAVTQAGLPYLVAERGGEVIGYAYASAYRPRSAYRHTIDDSVYIADGLAGGGVGRALLAALIERCEAGPWKQLIAVIGNSGNAASIALHERLGFEHVGVLRKVGFKHGKWIDSVLMQRALIETAA